MTTKIKFKNLIVSFLLVIAVFLSFFVSPSNKVSAESVYTNVLEDLRKSSEFKESDYTFNKQDYSLDVITISESVNNELFVYVYQPSANFADLRATSISMAYKGETSLDYNIYNLNYINSNGVFYKYVVNGYTVSNSTTREYEITEIFREFNIFYGDEELVNSNTTNEVAFPVAKHFEFNTVNGQNSLTVSDLDYIKVTDKYVGFVRYFHSDFWEFEIALDNHFIAFSTDKVMDDLLEADVYFKSQLVTKNINDLFVDYGEVITNRAYLKKGDELKHFNSTGIFNRKQIAHSWKTIQTVEEFIDTENFQYMFDSGVITKTENYTLSDKSIAEIKSKQWVLRFAETPIGDLDLALWMLPEWHYIISEVSVLRLKFKTDGVIYNLGVVDNKTTGSQMPDNEHTATYDFIPAVKVVLSLLLFVVVILILSPVLDFITPIFRTIGQVLTSPFKLIGNLFKKDKKKKNGKKQKV